MSNQAMPNQRPILAPSGRRRKRRRLPTVVTLALLVAAAGTAGTLIAARSAVDVVARVPGVADVLSGAGGDVENFLLVGSDSRANADPTSPDYGGIGNETDVSGNRSDTIMILRRDRATGSASLLSIPRDLWVTIAGHSGQSRINGAFQEGPSVLVQTVQQALDIPVHHYVEIDFSGFKSLVDAIDGVQVCFQHPTRDTNTGLNIPEGGCYVLDGVQALAYARSRHYEEFLDDGQWHEDASSDLGRTKRQRDFVNVMLQSAVERVKADPFIVGDVMRGMGEAVQIDEDLDVIDAASTMRTAADAGLATYALPVVGKTIDGKAVLLLGDGSDAVLAYFRGDGPAPEPNA